MKMFIQTVEMRERFINGLGRRYARALPLKSIRSKADIMFAATHLYTSDTPFVAALNQEDQPHYGSDEIPLLVDILDPFVTMVWEYFNINAAPATQQDFDAVHEQLCNEFLQNIEVAGRYTHTYGNAQKMVNMLFKYLACFADAAEFDDRFKYCHLTLDRFTYNGYRLPFYRDVVYVSIHGHHAPELEVWSKIASYSDYKAVADEIIAYINSHPKTYNDYVDICDRFDTLNGISKLSTEEDYVLTPFEAEFFLWTIAKACKNSRYPIPFVRSIEALL